MLFINKVKRNIMDIYEKIRERVYNEVEIADAQTANSHNEEERTYNKSYSKNLKKCLETFNKEVSPFTDNAINKWFLTNSDLNKSQKERLKKSIAGADSSEVRAVLNSNVDFYSAVEMVIINNQSK